MVEARRLERHQQVHVQPGRRVQPREHEEVAPVAAVEHRHIVVVTQDRHRSGPRRHAAHGRQEQTGQLRVAQGVGADRQPVLVVEEAECRLFARAEEVRLVPDPTQPHHEVRPPAPDAGDDVEQAGPARPQHLLPFDDDGTVRRDPAQSEPRLGERAQGLVAGGVHSGGRSSRARSNHKNP